MNSYKADDTKQLNFCVPPGEGWTTPVFFGELQAASKPAAREWRFNYASAVPPEQLWSQQHYKHEDCTQGTLKPFPL